MRAFAAVFTREIFERRFAFLVAFAAGFVPLIGSGLYGWSSPDAPEGRVLVALVGATTLSAAFAILLGGAVIAGETKEKRISFFFSRPIPSASLWAGKLVAAILVAFATALLAFAPGWLSGTRTARSLWGFDATPGNTALAALVLAAVLVLGSHAVVTVARLRSPWVVLGPDPRAGARPPRGGPSANPPAKQRQQRSRCEKSGGGRGDRAHRGHLPRARPRESRPGRRGPHRCASRARRVLGRRLRDRRRRHRPPRWLRLVVRLGESDRPQERHGRRSDRSARARGSQRAARWKPGAGAARSSSTRPVAAPFASTAMARSSRRTARAPRGGSRDSDSSKGKTNGSTSTWRTSPRAARSQQGSRP